MAVKKMGVTFFIFFRKRGDTQKGEAPSEKGGSKPGENYVSLVILIITILEKRAELISIKEVTVRNSLLFSCIKIL